MARDAVKRVKERLNERMAQALTRRTPTMRAHYLRMAAATEARLAAAEFAPPAPAAVQEPKDTPWRNLSPFDADEQNVLRARYGPLEDGYVYHQLAAPHPSDDPHTRDAFRSAPNVIKLPKLFHEEILLVYASPCLFGGQNLAIGAVLQSRSDEIRREAGVRLLQQLGCVSR